jgi:Cu(I)/Ag(I) efflux system membrane fusion protein
MKTFLLLVILGFVAGCAKPGGPAASDVDYYTCAMHPSVRSNDPDAKCPICGMPLIPVKKTGAPAEGGRAAAPAADAGRAGQPREFTIPLDRQQLIGVTYAPVERRPLARRLRAVGVVAATTAKHWDYVARVDGYVHELKVSAPGDPVKRGQVLMDLYSPDLVATENEYVDLQHMRANGAGDHNGAAVENATRLLSASRERLRQWNISDAQIDALEKSGHAEEYLPLNSPVDGIVEEVAVHQGRHVAVGDHLVDLVDLSAVWVWADFYENELPLLRPGTEVTVTSASLPGVAIAGKIAVLDPFLDAVKRTGRVRIDVDNASGQLRPEAYVDVSAELDGGTALAVPVEAVLPTGEHNLVFVDRGGGRLEPRDVQLGGKFGGFYEVQGGLKAGERVVSSANFLVDAESEVQGALKSW